MPHLVTDHRNCGNVVAFPAPRVARRPADQTAAAYRQLTNALVLAQHGAGKLHPEIVAAFEAAGWQLPPRRLGKHDLMQQIVLARAEHKPAGATP